MNTPSSDRIDYSCAEISNRNFCDPTAVWYFVKGGKSLHTADLIFRIAPKLAVFQIVWDEQTSKTLLARFRRLPGGISDWIEVTGKTEFSRILSTLHPDTRGKVERLLKLPED